MSKMLLVNWAMGIKGCTSWMSIALGKTRLLRFWKEKAPKREMFVFYAKTKKGCNSTLLEAYAEKYPSDCLDWNRCEAARAAGLSNSEDFINEVLDDAASVMNLTEEEYLERIL
ncbi:hypothetical protein TNCV_3896071 [Trichonephila clavipes]|nr:hypothetical protein TNCV_3896071 [Trichonephila clavipes]